MNWKIPLFRIYTDERDARAVAAVLRRGTQWAVGPEIEKFEKELARFVGTRYAVVFNSGTSALETLLLSYGVEEKEVIVPSFTFIATANAVVLAGGKPIFAEVETGTYGLDAHDVKKRITPRTRAIITIQYGGCAGRDTQKLRQLADAHHLLFIEDAAQSLGSRIGSKKVGAFGHAAIFSFCQDKVLSTGEGGVLVTNNEEVCEKAKLIRSHGRVERGEDYFSSTKNFNYVRVGYNYRMPSMLAALGLSQLKKIERIITLRRKNADYLSRHLSRITEIAIPRPPQRFHHIYQKYALVLGSEETRNGLQAYLTAHGIMTKVYFAPIHLTTFYRQRYGAERNDLPRTETLSKRILNLPIYPGMTSEERRYLVKIIRQYFSQKT